MTDKETLSSKLDSIRPLSILRLAVPILGLIGIGISSYLTYIHYQDTSSICMFGAKCDTVLNSKYADIGDVPLSLFGLLMYATLTALGFLNLSQRIGRRDVIAGGIYMLALSGTFFSLYLYYLEIFEIHDFCTWCIGSSVVTFALLWLSVANLRTTGFSFSEYLSWLQNKMPRFKW